MKYAWIFASIAAIAVGAWWWRGRPGTARPATTADGAATRDGGAVAAAAPSPDAAGAPVAVPAPVRATTGALPPPEPEPPATGIDGVPFDREPRDPAWAGDQERELRVRLEHVDALIGARGAKVTIAAAECHTTQCQVTVDAGAEADLSALYGALESPDGFYGWADSIVLGQVDTDPATGKLTTKIVAVFEREL